MQIDARNLAPSSPSIAAAFGGLGIMEFFGRFCYGNLARGGSEGTLFLGKTCNCFYAMGSVAWCNYVQFEHSNARDALSLENGGKLF